jgi:hypothetical protein
MPLSQSVLGLRANTSSIQGIDTSGMQGTRELTIPKSKFGFSKHSAISMAKGVTELGCGVHPYQPLFVILEIEES